MCSLTLDPVIKSDQVQSLARIWSLHRKQESRVWWVHEMCCQFCQRAHFRQPFYTHLVAAYCLCNPLHWLPFQEVEVRYAEMQNMVELGGRLSWSRYSLPLSFEGLPRPVWQVPGSKQGKNASLLAASQWHQPSVVDGTTWVGGSQEWTVC